MSMSNSTPTRATPAPEEPESDPDSEIEELRELVYEQQSALKAQQERLDELSDRAQRAESKIKEQADRINQLESAVQQPDPLATAVNRRVNTIQDLLVDEQYAEEVAGSFSSWAETFARDATIAERLKSKQFEQLEDLRERYLSNHRTTRREHALVLRQLHHLADETGVDLEASIPGDDKIATIEKHGIASVKDKFYSTDERAEAVIQNLDEWATIQTDKNGRFAYLSGPAIRQHLEDARDESLQTVQVRRVFEKIVELAEGSSRQARCKKTDAGTWRLILEVGDR